MRNLSKVHSISGDATKLNGVEVNEGVVNMDELGINEVNGAMVSEGVVGGNDIEMNGTKISDGVVRYSYVKVNGIGMNGVEMIYGVV